MKKYLTATTYDSSIFEMDKTMLKQTIYNIVNFKKLDIEILRKSLSNLIKDLPIIASKIEKRKWRDHWVPIQDFNIDSMIQTVKVDKNSFYDKAYLKFTQIKNKSSNLDYEPPLKLLVFYNEDISNKVVAFCIHHALADPRGCSQLIKLIGEYYQAAKNNTVIKPRKNYRMLFKLFFSFGIIKIIKALIQTISEGAMKPASMVNYKPLVEMDFNNENRDGEIDETIERIKLNGEEVNKLKAYYRKYQFTINDIILILSYQLMVNYNKKLKEPSPYVVVSTGVDLRKHIKKDILSITVYSGRAMIMIKTDYENNLEQLSKVIKEYKRDVNGIGALFMNVFMGLFPVLVMRKLLKSLSEILLQWWIRGVTTTNIGKLDDSVEPYGDMVDEISALSGSSYCGFPIINCSGYKDTITLYFSKCNDKSGLTQKVKKEFYDLIYDIIRK